eukprot:5075832-Pyramimonas_sp.AAC.1
MYVLVAPPGATRSPRNLIVYASWRVISGHTARETMYYKMGILYVRVGRAPPSRTYGISMSLCVPLDVPRGGTGQAQQHLLVCRLLFWPSCGVECISRASSAVPACRDHYV